jgi:hypothetical protein
MTLQERLEILEAALNHIASIDDGDVASLIKTNRLAEDALGRSTEKAVMLQCILRVPGNFDINSLTMEYVRENLSNYNIISELA